MSNSECPVCFKSVSKGLSITHEVCGHMTHGHCMDQTNPDFDRCVNCQSGSTLQVSNAPSSPRSFQGRDYIGDPMMDSAGILASLSGMLKRNPAKELLAKGKSLKHLKAQHDAHLQYMLHHGVTIDDYLKNGYTYADLERCYSDLTTRRKDTLFALGCNADHFRLDQVPIGKDISGSDMIEYFGLHFPPGCQPLVAYGSSVEKPWTMKDLIKLGLRAKDLRSAGLEYFEQYQNLFPQDREEEIMGITDEFVEELPFYGHPPIEDREERIVVKIQRPIPVATREKKKKTLPVRYHGLKE